MLRLSTASQALKGSPEPPESARDSTRSAPAARRQEHTLQRESAELLKRTKQLIARQQTLISELHALINVRRGLMERRQVELAGHVAPRRRMHAERARPQYAPRETNESDQAS